MSGKSNPKAVKLPEFLPAWTRRAVIESTGRDPLGLARVSDAITDFLLPGITTQTSRARYYSFYPWCLWHIQQTEPTNRYGEFVEKFQRRDAALALATLAHGEGDVPVGVDAARPRMEEAKLAGEADTSFRVLPSNPLGGFGQYYKGSLRKLQLIQYQDGVERVAEGMGTKLAEAFQDSVKETLYIKKGHFKESMAPWKDLNKSSDALNLNAIEWDPGRDERALLKSLFFEIESAGEAHSSTQRSSSLGQILHLFAEYERHGLQVSWDNLDTALVYWPRYFGILFHAGSRVIRYRHPGPFDSVHGMWRQFCLHQYLTLALEEMLAAVLDTLTPHQEGLSLDELVDAILSGGFEAGLGERVGTTCSRPMNLLAGIGTKAPPTDQICLQMQQELIPGRNLNEQDVTGWRIPGPEGRLVRSLCLLAILFSKWRAAQSDAALCEVQRHAGAELWFAPVGEAMDSWLDAGETWGSWLKTFIQVFILQRHDVIMFQKGRLDASWIGKLGAKLTKEQDLAPDVGSSRHWNAVRILKDLCLLKEEEGNLLLTREGKQLLKRFEG